MANKREISVAINLTTKIEEAQKNIANLQKDLNKLDLSSSMQNEFQSLFSGIEREINKINQKTAGGKLKFIDNAAIEKSIEKIDSLYGALIQKLESQGVAAAGLKEDIKAINAINLVLKAYNTSLQGIEKEEAKLHKELEKQKSEKEKLLETQKQQEVVSKEEIAAQEVRTKSAKEAIKLKEKELKVAQEILDKKIEESGGKYTRAQMNEKGSSLRKTDAYKSYKAIAKTVTEAKEQYEIEKRRGALLTTEEQQKKALTEVENKIQKATEALVVFNETQKTSAEIKAFEQIKKQLEEVEGLDLSNYGIDLTSIKNIEELRAALDNLTKASNKNAQALGEKVVKSAKAAEEAHEQLSEEVKEGVRANEIYNESLSQQEAMQEKIKSFLGIAGASQVMRRALRDAMSTITELDATMTEMAVVTDLTVGDYWDQLPQYSKQASDLGVSINSAYKAATLYYQQGLKSNDVTKISAQTLKMAKIAGMDAAEATDKMTAALRGFNMELNEASAQRVSDVYSELAAITAADTREIANAMTKTASIAASAGMEFETTAAFLSQIIETTRESAETAGTAMKTVIARFQELKKSPDDIGEIEGEIVDANAIETALRQVGVSLRDSSGQFRELDDVFLELSSKWDTLDKNTQRYIATIAAGSRQQSRFIAMMSDYARTQELVNAANTSAGASNEQFEKTMDSLRAKIEKLKNAWHEFSMGILESELVKVGVDILTKFLETVNRATSSLGSMGNSLTKIMSVLTVFKLGSKIFEKFKEPILEVFTSIANEANTQGYKTAKNWHEGAKAYWSEIGSEGTPDGEGQGVGISPNKTATKKQPLTFSQMWDNSVNSRAQAQKEKEALGAMRKKGNKKQREKTLEAFKKDGLPTKDLEKDLEDYRKQEEKYLNASQKAWQETGKAINKAGQNITGMGVGISMLGGLLQQLGLEEFGETLTQIGQYATIAGSAISALGSLVTLLGQSTFLAGIAAQVGWLPIIAVFVGIIAIVAVAIKVFKDLKANSPEGQLKAAQEEAENAARAADHLTESYNNLNNSIDELGDKYKALEELKRGTKEWNDAVKDINDSVLDLVEQYPELAELMQNKRGVLTLDLEDDAVKNILIEAETASIITQNTAKTAKAAAAQKEYKMLINNFAEDTKEKIREEAQQTAFLTAQARTTPTDFTSALLNSPDSPWAAAGELVGNWISSLIQGKQAQKEGQEILELAEGSEDKLALALSQKLIYRNAQGQYQIVQGKEKEWEKLGITLNEKTQQYLQRFGLQLETLGVHLETQNQILDNNAIAIAENTKALISFDSNQYGKNSDKYYDYMNAILTDDDYINMRDEEMKKLTVLNNADILRILNDTFGLGTTYDYKTKTVMSATGEKLMEGVGDEYFKLLEANRLATERFVAAGQAAPGVADILARNVGRGNKSTIDRLLSDATGGELRQQDYSVLGAYVDSSGNATQHLSNVWRAMSKAEQDSFGSVENLAAYISNAINTSKDTFGDAGDILTGAGYGSMALTGISGNQAKAIAQVASSMSKSSNIWGRESNFITALNQLMGSKEFTEEQKATIASELAAFKDDPTNREKWEGLVQVFKDYGLPITPDLQNFITDSTEGANAVYSNKWLQEMGVSANLEALYRKAIESEDSELIGKFHETFKEWRKDYDVTTDKTKKAEHELITKVAEKLTENLDKQLEEQENLTEATNEANDKLLDKIQQSIDQDRQQREQEKAEEGIEDKYTQLAYLQQDTSGGNALDIARLQKEIEESEQDYQDMLIDQRLQELSDDNERAAEQRERQIELLSLQLEAYKEKNVYEEAKEIVSNSLTQMALGSSLEETELGKLLSDKIFASDFDKSTYFTELLALLSQAIPKPTTQYATGGLANFTGPAWLDGTPSRPEYVLNAAQTERFFSLVDVLEGFDTEKSDSKISGDNYFDIEINVEKVDSDYDIEQIATKIRSMIYDDATYRNVNAINHIR